ncbi:MAG: hypothetical protein WCY09_09190 [Candidatus Omnitrophota bacterium]|jgi:hypothetical protein
MKKEYTIEFPGAEFSMSMDEFPKTLLGRTMYDIHFLTGVGCQNKKAYKELLRETAKQIIRNVKENKF